ncbi:MAG: metal-sulfur cluster assembly factor [Gemmatimonadota bacterium]
MMESDHEENTSEETAAGGPTAEETTAEGTTPEPGSLGALEGAAEEVRQALRSVIDPELGINIVDLGLVYGVDVDEGTAHVSMTLTSPGCPAGGQLLGGAKAAAESVEGVAEAVVSLVWKPFWTPERMDAKVRAMMGF